MTKLKYKLTQYLRHTRESCTFLCNFLKNAHAAGYTLGFAKKVIEIFFEGLLVWLALMIFGYRSPLLIIPLGLIPFLTFEWIKRFKEL